MSHFYSKIALALYWDGVSTGLMEQEKWLPKGPGRVSFDKERGGRPYNIMATTVEKVYGALKDGSFPFVA